MPKPKAQPRATVIGELQAIRQTLQLVADNTAPVITLSTTQDAQPRDLLVPTMIKLGSDGQRLPDKAKGHAAVLLPGILFDGAGLMFDARKPPKATDWGHAKQLGAAVDLFGKNDWQLATRGELALLIDDTQSKPACSPLFFPNMPYDDWCWTRTELASSPSDFVNVHFNFGFVFNGHQDSSGFVVACRRVPAGQF